MMNNHQRELYDALAQYMTNMGESINHELAKFPPALGLKFMLHVVGATSDQYVSSCTREQAAKAMRKQLKKWEDGRKIVMPAPKLVNIEDDLIEIDTPQGKILWGHLRRALSEYKEPL